MFGRPFFLATKMSSWEISPKNRGGLVREFSLHLWFGNYRIICPDGLGETKEDYSQEIWVSMFNSSCVILRLVNYGEPLSTNQLWKTLVN